MRSPPKFLLWLTPVALLSCAYIFEAKQQDASTAEAGGTPEPYIPSMNHVLHLGQDLACSDCHDPEETGEPALPDVGICFECHEDLSEEPDRIRAYFDEIRQPDGTYLFPKLVYSDDIIVNHQGHAGYKVTCADCHGEPGEKAFRRPPPLMLKATCMNCHEQRGASNDCAVCHKETRKDVRPPDHDEAFRAAHGQVAPEGWRQGRGESCALCHEVPQDCNTCHLESKPDDHLAPGFQRVHGQAAPEGWPAGEGGRCALCHEVPQDCHQCHSEVKPETHREAGFRMFHGIDTDAWERPFENTSCALCHEEQSCVRCHQTALPRSHTNPFKRRLHGIAADIERQTCQTCHKQDFCIRCHESVRPLSHRGSFGSGAQAHCLTCHDPLPSNGCYVCHKNTLGHLTATPLPAGPPHATATDCLTCHRVLPHFDDGGNCRRCHR